ncbi:MAG TPA: hypothetical protein PLV36_08700, partial [Zoogloea sp.]|nr:hypothetical protein [Zoogloea sp.]
MKSFGKLVSCSALAIALCAALPVSAKDDQKGMSGMSGMQGQKGMSGMSGMEGQKGMSGMSGMEG